MQEGWNRRTLFSTVDIDDDVRAEYWIRIRKKPELKEVKHFKAKGKTLRESEATQEATRPSSL